MKDLLPCTWPKKIEMRNSKKRKKGDEEKSLYGPTPLFLYAIQCRNSVKENDDQTAGYQNRKGSKQSTLLQPPSRTPFPQSPVPYPTETLITLILITRYAQLYLVEHHTRNAAAAYLYQS